VKRLIERESLFDIHAPHDGEAGAVDGISARTAPVMELGDLQARRGGPHFLATCSGNVI
jgi:hypothetical protein